MNSSLSPFASENLVSRDEFDSPVPHQPAHLHTQAESGAYLRIIFEFRGGVHLLSVHIVYYECSSTYMYMIYTMISAVLLACSVSSTNEGSRVK